MNTSPSDLDEARGRRRRRAMVAERLLTRASEAAAALDWDTLDRAPAWLALPDAKLAGLKREVGAVLYAPEMQLWIDGRRLAAARAALGESFLQTLLAQRDLPSVPNDVVVRLRIDTAEQVGPLLQVAGAAVLLATLPEGPLRRAGRDALAPVAVSTMASEHAQLLLARAQALAAQCAAVAPFETAPGAVDAAAPAPAPGAIDAAAAAAAVPPAAFAAAGSAA